MVELYRVKSVVYCAAFPYKNIQGWAMGGQGKLLFLTANVVLATICAPCQGCLGKVASVLIYIK